jgi:hypothetical protein
MLIVARSSSDFSALVLRNLNGTLERCLRFLGRRARSHERRAVQPVQLRQMEADAGRGTVVKPSARTASASCIRPCRSKPSASIAAQIEPSSSAPVAR